ncbi:MAG TPA: hypothetical protein VEB68_07055 [Croceibacterium sp.]|nr:hypothetical protein [Croceibacterium sp.]
MKATRRGVLAGALTAPALAGLPTTASARSGDAVLLHDPSLVAGRRFAEACGSEALPIEGDRVRLARAVFARRPAFVVGVSRPADALLIEDVAREAGYAPADDGRVRDMTAATQPLDCGLVLGWVLVRRV